MLSTEQLGQRVALISMAVSGLLAAAKLTVGTLAGSMAVVADGIESASDVLVSGVVLLGLWIASRPPDDNHPYGHGRFEILTGLGVSLALSFTGVFICWRSLSGLAGPHEAPAAWAIYPLIASILAKSGLSIYKFRTGGRIGSTALIADAWNDTVDILSGAVALIAVGLTLSDPLVFATADHWGGFAIGIIVVALGLRLMRDAALHLMDTMPSNRRMGLIRASALSIPGALAVEKCFARKTGLRYHVDLHLEVDPELSVRLSHSLAEQVRNKIKDDLPWVADVLVHVEPHEGSSAST